MVDRKVVVVVAVAVGVVLIGGIAGAMLLGGGGGGDDTDAGGSDGSDGSDDGGGSAATPTQATSAGNGTGTNGTAAPTETAFPTLTPTSVPTPTGTPTVAPTPTEVPTRTPMLPRRFSEQKIEMELRRMINDWREEEKGLDPFTNANGSLVSDLDEMSLNHSRAMRESGKLTYASNNLSVAQRYEAFELATTCQFKEKGRQNIVTPDRYQFQVMDRTYVGRNYEDDGETVYHENETAVARDIFETWKNNYIDARVLSWANSNRLGLGIEITEDNEVWVTGNICGAGETSN